MLKLRLHTDETLEYTDMLIVDFGKLMRQFRDTTCEVFETVELPKEAAAHIRRQATNTTSGTPASSKQPKQKKRLNLTTIKFHALGDYTHHIHKFGTTDSYTTQLVCHYL